MGEKIKLQKRLRKLKDFLSCQPVATGGHDDIDVVTAVGLVLAEEAWLLEREEWRSGKENNCGGGAEMRRAASKMICDVLHMAWPGSTGGAGSSRSAWDFGKSFSSVSAEAVCAVVGIFV